MQASTGESAFDLWLVRIGSITQVGLLVATILGFYFTDIPLYQKAAMDEQLAKRDAELKVANESIAAARREAYEQHRTNLMERLALRLPNDCSGIRVTMTQPALHEPEEPRHARLVDLGLDVAECLSQGLASSSASKVLTASDYRTLLDWLLSVGTVSNANQREATRRIEALPGDVRRDPLMLDPPSDFMKEVYAREDEDAADLRSLGVTLAPHTATRRLNRALARTQERIATDVRRGEFETLLKGLREFSWPPA